MNKYRNLLFLLVATGLTCGCGRASLQGMVVNQNGEALPGVAVLGGRDGRQALTDARGAYRLPYSPGRLRLTYSKSGYTTVDLQLDLPKPRRIAAPTARLWLLPPKAGVYLFENKRYIGTTWVLPEQHFLAVGDLAYSTKRSPDSFTHEAQPQIICFRTPRYDARLARLRQVEARLPATDAEAFKVWTDAGSVAANLTLISESDSSLLRLAVDQPLEPGVYAIHWGALEGYTTLENRIFMFEVREQPEVIEDEVPPEPGPAPQDDPAPEILEPADSGTEPDILEPADALDDPQEDPTDQETTEEQSPEGPGDTAPETPPEPESEGTPG